MADVRYSVPGVPHGPAAGLSAFMPAFTRHAASSAAEYKYAVRGYPGTRAIPMTALQDTYISPDRGDAALSGSARSTDAPDAIWPNQYYQGFIAEPPGGPGMPVQVYDPTRPGLTSLLPVPAQDWRGLYGERSARLSRRAVLQRAKSLPVFARRYSSDAGGVPFNG